MPPARKVDPVAITGLERWWGFTAISFSENPVSCHAYYSKTVNPVTQEKTYGCKAVNPIPTLWPGFPEAVAFDPKGVGCGQAVSCNVCWTWSKWWWDPSGWLCFTLENHNTCIYIYIQYIIHHYPLYSWTNKILNSAYMAIVCLRHQAVDMMLFPCQPGLSLT